jgi:glycosyltransferase involved in cell wall biosynthesis
MKAGGAVGGLKTLLPSEMYSPSSVATSAGTTSEVVGLNQKRVTHLTSVHSAIDSRIFHKECKSLAEAGYEVTLIAPHHKTETIDGVRIVPVRRNKRRYRRMTQTMIDIWRKARQSEADLYHFHDPELLLVGVLLKAAGKRVIYDAHEHLGTDILTKGWIHNSLRTAVSGIAGSIEKFVGVRCNAIVAATPFIADTFCTARTVLVQNFPRLDEFLNYENVLPYDQREYRAVYVGSAERLRGACEMVSTARLLPARLGARFTLIGGTESPEFAADLRAMEGWERIDHVGFQGRPSVVRHLTNARVGLVVLHPTPGFLNSQPVKLFEYMAAGIPVVASNFPDWRRFVDEVGCGISVNPLDVAEITQAVTWLFDHPHEAELMGARGQAAVRSTYNWDAQASNLIRLYEEVLQ